MGPDSSLPARVLSLWPDWYGTDPPPLTWLLAATGRPIAQTAVTLIAVDDRSGTPLLTAKVNRSPRFSEVTAQEYETQLLAHKVMSPDHPMSVARPIDILDVGGDVYLISEFAPSDRTWDANSRHRQADLARWLGALHDRTRTARSGSRLAVSEVETAFVELFDPVATVRNRLREGTEMVVAECERSTHETLVHGDFWPGNWLLRDDSFTVIDWEHAHHSPTPVLDEFLFPLSEVTLRDPGEAVPEVLRRFSDLYRSQRGLESRSDDDVWNASLWVAAEVATRTYRRWEVVEDWSHNWAGLIQHLASR